MRTPHVSPVHLTSDWSMSSWPLVGRSVQGPDPDTNPDRVGQYNPNIGAGVAIGRGWSLDGAEFKAYYLVARQFILVLYVNYTALNLTLKSQTMSIEFIYIMPLLVNNLVESRDSFNINETAGLHSVCHTVT